MANATETDTEGIKLMKKKAIEISALFQKWQGGPYWTSNIKFKSFIDVIMHLLFLGVTKTCKEIMLNIPATMKNFGPLINYWEGSMHGKGCLRLVKPKVNSIHIKKWHV